MEEFWRHTDAEGLRGVQEKMIPIIFWIYLMKMVHDPVGRQFLAVGLLFAILQFVGMWFICHMPIQEKNER